MNQHKKLIVLTIALLSITIIVAMILAPRSQSDRKRNGHVVGENPSGIPIDELPVCNFTGAGYMTTPCYEPDGTINM